MTSRIKKIWFLTSIILSVLFSLAAYRSPEKFVPMSDLLATIIAILIGVSLAVSAVLANPPNVDINEHSTIEESQRAQDIINKNYTSMLDGQRVLFWVYYASLILAVCLKFTDVYFAGEANTGFYNTIMFKLIAMAFAFVSSFALFWSATLPTMLHQVNTHKMKI